MPHREFALRQLTPADFEYVITRIDAWWGRPMRHLLPRLFFDHFHDTSLAADDGTGRLGGFLVGFLSPAEPDLAYVHFLGVDPEVRGAGLGRRLHAGFADLAAAAGRTRVGAITSPLNAGSIAFHTSLGFSARLDPDHEGPGLDFVVFERRLG